MASEVVLSPTRSGLETAINLLEENRRTAYEMDQTYYDHAISSLSVMIESIDLELDLNVVTEADIEYDEEEFVTS